MSYVVLFEQLRMTDVDSVGGKNASLGEMISQLSGAGVRVPGGFATTADAFRDFLKASGLDKRIAERLTTLNPEDVRELATAGAQIRQWLVEAPFSPEFEAQIREAFAKLDADGKGSFAVRSSATAEDLPDASFAGQQETFLNVVGIDDVLDKIRHVFASLYNDRAISYRVHKGYAHADVALSAGIQRMVRSDKGSAGVMFTIDTESGFQDVVFITSSYGLGETVVQGAVNPDEFYVFKPTLAQGHFPIVGRRIGSKLIKMEFDPERPEGRAVRTVDVPVSERNRYSLTDDEVNELARYAVIIEKHYQRPMDIEWGRDGVDGKIYILQARPETVKSQQGVNDVQQRYPPEGDRPGPDHRPRDRPEDRFRPRARGGRHLRHGQGPTRRCAGHRHDGSQLGARDEACRRHRDEPRRPYVPCRDHRARTGHPGRGGLRQRHRPAEGRPGGDRLLRRRRRGPYL